MTQGETYIDDQAIEKFDKYKRVSAKENMESETNEYFTIPKIWFYNKYNKEMNW